VASSTRNKNHSPVITRLRSGMSRPFPGKVQLEMADVLDGSDVTGVGKTRRTRCNC
jgi:hypothetical protein